MTDQSQSATDAKTKIDTLFKLSEHSWRAFDTNRSYEWKVSLALWTALAAFSALVIKEHKPLPEWTKIASAVIFVFIFFAYWFAWTTGGWKHNYFADEEANHYLNSIRDLIGEPKKELHSYGAEPSRKFDPCNVFRVVTNWSRGFQLAVTLVLSLVAAVAIWL